MFGIHSQFGLWSNYLCKKNSQFHVLQFWHGTGPISPFVALALSHEKILVKFPWKLLSLLLLFLVNFFTWISHAVILSVHWFNQIVESWFIFQAMLVLCLSHTDSSNSLPELRNLHRVYTTDRFLVMRRSSDLITNMYLRFVFWFYKLKGHQGDVWGGGASWT